MAIAKGTITLSNLTDSLTVLISPSSCIISTDADGSNPDFTNAYADVTVARGNTLVEFILTFASASSQGIGYSITDTDNYHKRIAITALPNDVTSGLLSFNLVTQDGYSAAVHFQFTTIPTASSGNQVQSDWKQDDSSEPDFIKNKPTDLGDFSNNAGYIKIADLPIASTSRLGVVKVDGTTITITASGVLSANVPTDVSAFNNDAGYITSADLTTYTAGNGIDISSNNYISVKINSNGANGLGVGGDGLSLTVVSPSVGGVGGTNGAMLATDKEKLDGISAGAEANVQSDWNQTSSSEDDYIKNKPTKLSDFTNDAGYITSADLPSPYSLPTASTSVLGGVMIDGTTITIDANGVISAVVGGSGTVTSVGMTVPTGLEVSGSPVTSSGTLAITFASGYSIPTTASQSNWDSAYSWGDHSQEGYLKAADISGKADKVSGATNGNFASLDANGNLIDSNSKASDFKTKQTAIADPSANGNALSFIDTLSQNANGEITVTKKTVRTMGASGTNHASGLVPDPGATAGTTRFLCENGTWDVPSGGSGGGGGTPTDVQINGTSITSNNVANIQTNGAYDASTNKIATMNDLPAVPVTDVTVGGVSVVSGGTAVIPAIPDLSNYVQKSLTEGLLKNDGTVDTNTYLTSHQDISDRYSTSDTAETALEDADSVPFYDNSATAKRKTLWSNIKAKLKAYFDTIYSTFSGSYTDLTDKPNIPSDLYKSVKVGTTTLTANGEDTLELKAGSNVTLTPNANDKSVTISATGSGQSSGDMLASDYDSDYTVKNANGIVAYVASQISGKANTADLASVAFSGSYTDLTDTPTLATVATSGLYSDLTGIPTNVGDFDNDVGYLKDVKIDGTSLTHDANDAVTIPIASNNALGVVKVDGTTITIDANGVISAVVGGSGTVTSVGMAVPTGLEVSGSPVTSSGTLAITFASGYSIPLTADVNKGVTAYGWGDHSQEGYLKAADLPAAADATPLMDGTASVGTSTDYAREDHVHPTDTSRVPTSRTINGYALTANITLDASDVGALPSSTVIPTVGTLNTNNATSLSVSSSESFGGSISLHKVSKTGSYNDLLNKPTALSDFTDDLGSNPTHTHSQYLTSHQTLPMYTIAKLTSAETGFFASYVLKKDGVQVGETINIPKDYLIKSGSVINVVEYEGHYYDATDTNHVTQLPVSATGKHLDFVVNTIGNDGTASHIYVSVNSLVDVYSVFSYGEETNPPTPGTNGLVPGPLYAERHKYLRGDGTWQTPTGTLDTSATSSLAIPQNTEPFSGNISLHRISKTGKFTDLNDRPLVSKTVSYDPSGAVLAGWRPVCKLQGRGIYLMFMEGGVSGSNAATHAAIAIDIDFAHATIKQMWGNKVWDIPKVRLRRFSENGSDRYDWMVGFFHDETDSSPAYINFSIIGLGNEPADAGYNGGTTGFDPYDDSNTQSTLVKEISLREMVDQPGLIVNLESDNEAFFDSKKETKEIGVEGELPISHGGTGANTAAGALANLMNGYTYFNMVYSEGSTDWVPYNENDTPGYVTTTQCIHAGGFGFHLSNFNSGDKYEMSVGLTASNMENSIKQVLFYVGLCKMVEKEDVLEEVEVDQLASTMISLQRTDAYGSATLNFTHIVTSTNVEEEHYLKIVAKEINGNSVKYHNCVEDIGWNKHHHASSYKIKVWRQGSYS